jgi:hypothetical protein
VHMSAVIPSVCVSALRSACQVCGALAVCSKHLLYSAALQLYVLYICTVLFLGALPANLRYLGGNLRSAESGGL